MKNLYFLTVAFLICVFYSCSKSSSSASPQPQVLIIGKWTLQQQSSILTVNGGTPTDTTLMASAYNTSDINFGGNGQFTSAGQYASPVSPGGVLGQAVADSSGGSYNFNNNVLDMSTAIVGFPRTSFFLTGSASVQPVLLISSHSAKVILLSSSTLKLQTEFIYTAATSAPSSSTTTYDYLNVYTFSR
jgi:hypothetical protein